jgi:undecaprenyl-diphosphatase
MSAVHRLTAANGIGGLSLGAPIGFPIPCAAVHDPISYFQAVILGLTQGIAEPFPISSLGHGVVIPSLFGWNIHQNDKFFLSFLVATHLATAIVLFFFFLRDWVRIFRGLGRSLRDRQISPDDTDAKLGWLLVVGTIPAGILGLLLQDPLRTLFASAQSAAAFLIVNGLLLIAFERLRRRAPVADTGGDHDAHIATTLNFRQALGVGSAQAIALVPGISRSGITMGGGLLAGLSNEDAARYGFLLATPIIGAAAVLKVPDLFGHTGDGVRGQALVAAICAGFTTYFAVKFLLRYFETNRLTPFGIYCVAAGAALTIGFALR